MEHLIRTQLCWVHREPQHEVCLLRKLLAVRRLVRRGRGAGHGSLAPSGRLGGVGGGHRYHPSRALLPPQQARTRQVPQLARSRRAVVELRDIRMPVLHPYTRTIRTRDAPQSKLKACHLDPGPSTSCSTDLPVPSAHHPFSSRQGPSQGPSQGRESISSVVSRGAGSGQRAHLGGLDGVCDVPLEAAAVAKEVGAGEVEEGVQLHEVVLDGGAGDEKAAARAQLLQRRVELRLGVFRAVALVEDDNVPQRHTAVAVLREARPRRRTAGDRRLLATGPFCSRQEVRVTLQYCHRAGQRRLGYCCWCCSTVALHRGIAASPGVSELVLEGRLAATRTSAGGEPGTFTHVHSHCESPGSTCFTIAAACQV